MGRMADSDRYVETGPGVFERYSGSPAEAAAYSEEDVGATDAAQELADELGVDISTVEGTGKDGRVTVADVRAAAAD